MLVTSPLVDNDLAQELAAALRRVAPSSVHVGARMIRSEDLQQLTQEEWTYVRRAVPRRQYEFASGRALLRELLAEPVSMPASATRAPVLPPGVRASLAHDHVVAVAAMTTDETIVALGVDVEPATPLSPDVARLVLRADEPDLDPHRAFTMKEAAYKAWSTLGGRLLDHHDVRLQIDGEEFRAEVIDDGAGFEGRSVLAADRWLTLVVVPGGHR